MAETLGTIAVAAGVGLVYAAITNQNPVAELRSALRTGNLSGSTPINSGTPAAGGTAGPTSTGGPASGLVDIGGGHKLTADAAVGFNRWRLLYGEPIVITGAWRSPEAQAAGYESDPTRFAAPGTSAHETGEAVDVNLSAMGMNPLGRNPAGWLADPKYLRLVKAALATGWCNYQIKNGTVGDKMAEPWHFSYKVCK